MPYIEKMARTLIDHHDDWSPSTEGELNYAITRIILDYLPPRPGYSDYNSVIGVLECAKLEFYRRAVAAYEDEKIRENGDVY